jgi:hypothetical protein
MILAAPESAVRFAHLDIHVHDCSLCHDHSNTFTSMIAPIVILIPDVLLVRLTIDTAPGAASVRLSSWSARAKLCRRSSRIMMLTATLLQPAHGDSHWKYVQLNIQHGTIQSAHAHGYLGRFTY